MTVNVKDNFIINPDKFYSPSYRIGPFSTLNIAKDISLKISSDYRSSFCDYLKVILSQY
jgi:hypothetical protein